MLSNFILLITLPGECIYHVHFIDEYTETQRKEETCIRSHSWSGFESLTDSHTRPFWGEPKANIPPVLFGGWPIPCGTYGLWPAALCSLPPCFQGCQGKVWCSLEFSPGGMLFLPGSMAGFSLNPGSAWILPGYTVVCVFSSSIQCERPFNLQILFSQLKKMFLSNNWPLSNKGLNRTGPLICVFPSKHTVGLPALLICPRVSASRVSTNQGLRTVFSHLQLQIRNGGFRPGDRKYCL